MSNEHISPSEEDSSELDGLEVTRRKWAQEKASGEWERAAKRQAEHHREKAKAPALKTDLQRYSNKEMDC
jgi:hypothetical protein